MRFLLPLLLLAVPAQAAEIYVTKEACEWFTRHEARADVEHRPNADVEIKGSSIQMPETITVPLTVDLAGYLGFSPVAAEMNAVVGIITVGPQGLKFNGKPLKSGPKLKALCAETPLD